MTDIKLLDNRLKKVDESLINSTEYCSCKLRLSWLKILHLMTHWHWLALHARATNYRIRPPVRRRQSSPRLFPIYCLGRRTISLRLGVQRIFLPSILRCALCSVPLFSSHPLKYSFPLDLDFIPGLVWCVQCLRAEARAVCAHFQSPPFKRFISPGLALIRHRRAEENIRSCSILHLNQAFLYNLCLTNYWTKLQVRQTQAKGGMAWYVQQTHFLPSAEPYGQQVAFFAKMNFGCRGSSTAFY